MLRTTDIIEPKAAKTIAGLFFERVRRTPHACAYRRFSEKTHRFEEITWKEVSDLAARWQAALQREDLHPGERVALGVKNGLEWVLFDLAALGLGLVTVPLFAFDRPENSAYILKETGVRLILLEDEEQWLHIRDADGFADGINRVVTLQKNQSRDPRIVELDQWLPPLGPEYLVNSREPKELATVVYTSGTTGLPKGVMLSHENILANSFACLQRESVYHDDVFLSILPLSHTFERTVGYYIPMMAGASVASIRSIDKLAEDFLAVRPTVLVSVPRIYERIHRKITAELERKSAPARLVFNLAVGIGWKRFLYLHKQRPWTPLFLLWPLLDKTVAGRVRALFGGKLRLSISGGAPLAFPVARVFIGLGLNLLQGYGLTETSPVVSVSTTEDNNPRTVGRPLPGVEPAIAANGELLVRGPNVMMGYWNSSRTSEAVIGPGGFLHTGDLARLENGGQIVIAGRLKEIIVLSTGEKISPVDLELSIAVNPLFEQVMVVGEGRPYLAALVVLNRPRWERLAAKHGITSDGPDLPTNGQVEKILLPEIAKRITRFPGYAQIRRVYATLAPWEMKDGLITNTLKLRRKKLLARFEREVALLFTGH
jgi:long-chain acyl-CoA synthetase